MPEELKARFEQINQDVLAEATHKQIPIPAGASKTIRDARLAVIDAEARRDGLAEKIAVLETAPDFPRRQRLIFLLKLEHISAESAIPSLVYKEKLIAIQDMYAQAEAAEKKYNDLNALVSAGKTALDKYTIPRDISSIVRARAEYVDARVAQEIAQLEADQALETYQNLTLKGQAAFARLTPLDEAKALSLEARVAVSATNIEMYEKAIAALTAGRREIPEIMRNFLITKNISVGGWVGSIIREASDSFSKLLQAKLGN